MNIDKHAEILPKDEKHTVTEPSLMQMLSIDTHTTISKTTTIIQ